MGVTEYSTYLPRHKIFTSSSTMAVVPRDKLESELRALVAVCDFNVITIKDIRKQVGFV